MTLHCLKPCRAKRLCKSNRKTVGVKFKNFRSSEQELQNNGSAFLHSFIVPRGYSPDPSDRNRYSRSETVHTVKMMNKFKKKRYAKTKNLITGETSATPEDQEIGRASCRERV